MGIPDCCDCSTGLSGNACSCVFAHFGYAKDFMSKCIPLFLLLASAVAQAADTIAGGPMAVNVTSKSATIVWIVEHDHASLKAKSGGETRVAPSLHFEKVTYSG